MVVAAASPDGRWVAVCQAREDTNGDGKIAVEVGAQGELGGDRLDGYFVGEPGPGTKIDSFDGSDPSGRWVAFEREGRLVLSDTTTRVDVDLSDLGADDRDDQNPFLHPRAVAFDPTGRRMLYLRRRTSGSDVVVRELSTGAEAIVDPGPGEVFRADFDPSGDWVVLRVVTADTNGNGRLDWPTREAKAPFMRCTGPIPRHPVWERPGDEGVTRAARVTGGTAVDAPGLVVPFGAALVERDAEGAFVLAEPNGSRSPFVPKSCEPHLLHVDAVRGVALATCAKKNGHADAELVARNYRKILGLELSSAAGDRWVSGAPRLVPLHPGIDAVLVDLERRQIEWLMPNDKILLTAGDHALVLRGRTLVVHELGGAEHQFPGTVSPLEHTVRSGTVMVVPPFVVDVATGALLGKTGARALAVASDGAVLAAEGRAADAAHLAVGPLSWSGPTPDATSD